MKGKKELRVLFIIPMPPPVHGSSMISQYIKDSRLINETFDCNYINLSASRKLNEIGRLNPIKFIRLLAAFFSLLWKLTIKRYDLCYLAITCHGIGFLKDTPFVLLCKLFRRKVVIHQHNKGMSKDVDKRPYRWLLPLVYKNAKVILLSWRLYPDIERIVSKDDIYICSNGIPEIDYKFKDKNNKIPHLLFLSNLIESKGVLVLLDALALLKDKGYSLLCDFIGGETKEIDRVRFEKEIEKRGLTQYAIYRGRLFGLEKEDYYFNADIFVFPTYYPNETFGLVNLEAMAHGLPIVTTNEGGIPDVVKNGENGLICEKNDSESLADCIELLVKDKDLRYKMGIEGYRRYKNEYTIEAFENRIKEILES